MNDNLKETLMIIGVCVAILLTITIPIVIGVCIYQDKQMEIEKNRVEIEKYRIEMELKYKKLEE